MRYSSTGNSSPWIATENVPDWCLREAVAKDCFEFLGAFKEHKQIWTFADGDVLQRLVAVAGPFGWVSRKPPHQTKRVNVKLPKWIRYYVSAKTRRQFSLVHELGHSLYGRHSSLGLLRNVDTDLNLAVAVKSGRPNAKRSFRRASSDTPLTQWLRLLCRIALPRAALQSHVAVGPMAILRSA